MTYRLNKRYYTPHKLYQKILYSNKIFTVISHAIKFPIIIKRDISKVNQKIKSISKKEQLKTVQGRKNTAAVIVRAERFDNRFSCHHQQGKQGNANQKTRFLYCSAYTVDDDSRICAFKTSNLKNYCGCILHR